MNARRLPFNQTRRGDIRLILLGVLAQHPRHGYDIIRHLEIKSGGAWRPSAGVIYPTLQRLHEEGLIYSEKVGNKLMYHLTEEGRQEVNSYTMHNPWESDEALLRQIAWVKQMANDLIQAYTRVLKTGDSERINDIQSAVEQLIENIQKEADSDK